MIKGEKVYLRAMEPEDLENLYVWENDPEVWSVSVSNMMYSKYVLSEYIANAAKSIYEMGQQRYIVCRTEDDVAIGTIDLFDFDAANRRAGVGILIYNKEDRSKGYATEALRMIEQYSVQLYNMNQLYCNVIDNNEISRALFPKMGYEQCGCKKKWIYMGGKWYDELMYQKLL